MVAPSALVFLDGEYVPPARAMVPVEDRGFNFGDGVYEVVPFYFGRPLGMASHVSRLARGLGELEIPWDAAGLASISAELIARNDLASHPLSIVYLQVTRGSAPRAHAFPRPAPGPGLYASARSFERVADQTWERGSSAITVSDNRWGRADLKTLQLLPNVMAQEAAVRAGADEVVLIRDGIALEGARNNLFAVVDGVLRTHPASNQILAGVTREIVLDIAREREYRIQEVATPLSLLRQRASEVFLTGSTSEVLPVVRIDGTSIGQGTVGPVARDLRAGLFERAGARITDSIPAG